VRRVAFLAVACLAATAGLVFGNARAQSDGAVARRPPASPRPPAAVVCALPTAYRSAFQAAARATGLPVEMLLAVGEVESRLKQQARSAAGAEGVLQVLPSTARALRLDPTRARENVLAGAVYLRGLLERFRSVDLALAAYNAGPSAVERAGGAPSGQSLTYVANVTARWRGLLRCR
jgi:soluble lytic murein transglycosylase-like protein